MRNREALNNIVLSTIQLTQALDATLDGLYPNLSNDQKVLANRLKANCKFWLEEFANKKDKELFEEAIDANGDMIKLFNLFTRMDVDTKVKGLELLNNLVNESR
jgi:hypothetical protein